jgi:hypothetical protein
MELAKYIDIMPDESPSDRRKVTRYRMDLPLRLGVASTEREETKLHFQVHDISSDGVFVKTNSVLPAGTVVNAEIDLPHPAPQFCRRPKRLHDHDNGVGFAHQE